MKSNWYSRLKCKIEISTAGIVAISLRTIFSSNQFQNVPVTRDLDSSIEKDITNWFTVIFNPWFGKLSTGIVVNNTANELTDSSYSDKINSIITALYVARTYYAKQADSSFITSLKSVALYKAAICEEVARSLGCAYEDALLQFGAKIIGKTRISTVASTYEGTGPENYRWDGDFLVNHVQYENIEVMSEKEEEATKEKRTKDYLPWVFTAAFGLIAWSAAAKSSK